MKLGKKSIDLIWKNDKPPLNVVDSKHAQIFSERIQVMECERRRRDTLNVVVSRASKGAFSSWGVTSEWSYYRFLANVGLFHETKSPASGT